MSVIYALAGGSTGDQKLDELSKRVQVLLADLSDQNAQVILPTVVIAEVLAGIDIPDHGKFLATLNARFITPPLDLRAAALAARLWRDHRRLPKEQQVARTVLKCDVLIIATAKVSGATVFYSHDAGARSIASLVMEAKDLPTHSENLFYVENPGIEAMPPRIERARKPKLLEGPKAKPKRAPRRSRVE